MLHLLETQKWVKLKRFEICGRVVGGTEFPSEVPNKVVESPSQLHLRLLAG